MPTVRPRHQVTETDEVAQALDLAARRWPGESRGRLLVRLLEVGAARLAADDRAERGRRAQLLDEFSATYADAYPAGYLEELREDWPE
jgi:hypothetical protein